ncbi:MAG: hypothetical protein EBR30_14425 [Cytophagia bacterium]|nr:hypothetical protein [Cytophagia bacterium]NBW36185.1 hypothetical protein [Cytophagia bacterium]
MKLISGTPIEVILHGIHEKGEFIKYLSSTVLEIRLERDSYPGDPNIIPVDITKYPIQHDKNKIVINIIKDL